LQVVLRMMEEVRSEELVKAWSKKMGPPLVTLLSAEPEVQYVALRNINLIVQRWPQILANEVKVGGLLWMSMWCSLLCGFTWPASTPAAAAASDPALCLGWHALGCNTRSGA
jgi:hypothetical protein